MTPRTPQPKRTPKRHAIDSLTPGCGFTICGVYSFNLEVDESKVTCKTCLKRLARKP